MNITTIAFDGDDTLWHHDKFFRAAIDEFYNIMNGLGNFPDARETLDTKHISDLPIWGYGVKGLILSMVELAITMTEGKITGVDIQRIFDIGKQTHLHPVILLDHVAQTIEALHGKYRLILITKGDLIAQEMKIHKSGLSPFFDSVEIISEKDVTTYQKIIHRQNVKPEEFIMIGNALRSDILPVIQLGGQAIHIPYQTSWHFETSTISEAEQKRFITLPSMKDVAEVITKLGNSEYNLLSEIYVPAPSV